MFEFMSQGVYLLVLAVIAVPLFKKLGLGDVLGYLVAGILAGPSVLGIVKNTADALHYSELGVVLLLFIIGLELNPKKLWTMRREIAGVGLLQVTITSGALAAVFFLLGSSVGASAALGMALALSSTAIALQYLQSKNRLGTPSGRATFGTLLMQDIAVIPMLAIVPLFAAGPATEWNFANILLGTAVVVGMVVIVPRAARPIFRYVATTRIHELFTALGLLLVFGTALVTHAIGLSMAMGSFLAGVILAESEYRHQLESDIEPFKGLFLGFFFMAVGMSIDMGVLASMPMTIISTAVGIMTLKMILFYGIGRLSRLSPKPSLLAAATLSQCGEFAFVFLQVALKSDVIDSTTLQMTQAVVALSMALTPLVLIVVERLIVDKPELEAAADEMIDEGAEVIMAGYGRFGQMIARMLNANGINATVLDHDAGQVELLRKFGNKAYYGDASRTDLLEQCGIARAKLLVIALDDFDACVNIIQYAKKQHPHIKIFARCRNRVQAFQLIELGVDHYYRETFDTALRCAKDTLIALGTSTEEAQEMTDKFYCHDQATLQRGAAIQRDEKQLVSLARESRTELEKLLQRETSEPAKTKTSK